MRKGPESVYVKLNISVVNFERTNLYATSVIDDPSPIYIVFIRFILLSKYIRLKAKAIALTIFPQLQIQIHMY